LSVFNAVTKEIVTETDHSWGAFGKKDLSWVLSNKKMAMIFEFEIDFRYDLRRPEFEVTETGASSYRLTLPPCLYEVHIRDIRFYDEQGAKLLPWLLPWLLPDLLNGFLGARFSEEDKNSLIRSAKTHAEQEAKKLIETLQAEVQSSAQAVLMSIGKAFGAESLDFVFEREEKPELKIAYPQKAA
jgi:hypothetical protein